MHLFRFLLVGVIVCMVSGIVSAGEHPFSYDPATEREYDAFGGFFDRYGHYIDPFGNVMDQYGELVRNSYNPSSDTYTDSKGKVYGPGPLSGNLKPGEWHFTNYKTYRYAWPTAPVTLAYNSQGVLKGTFTNSKGQSTILRISQTRRYVGRDPVTVSLNLRSMMDPETKESLYSESEATTAAAKLLLDEKAIDSDGYMTSITGTFNPSGSVSNCLWYAQFVGVAYDNGKRFVVHYQRCAECEKTTDRNSNVPGYVPDAYGAPEVGYCDIMYNDQGQGVIHTASFEMVPLNLAGDWLGDGQQVDDPQSSPSTNNVPTGNNPFSGKKREPSNVGPIPAGYQKYLK